ncbi:MAG: adenylate kinase, partial [Bacteroidetes bacterium GWF2_49_14]
MNHIVLFGPPGCGKGTQAQMLVEHCSYQHVSTGELLRVEMSGDTELGLEAKKYIDKGELVPDQTVIGMICHYLKENGKVPGIIYDGFPRTITQAEALDEMLASRNENIGGLFSLEVPHEELIKRLTLRGISSGRIDDSDIATIENRISVYEEKTQPLIDYYTRQGKYYGILGTGTIEEIAERLINA